jgi:pSer/pThr/pTyr-binding forkhead associated (FHA) protein
MGHAQRAEDYGATTENRTKREAPFGAPYVFTLLVIDGDDPNGVHRLARTETIIGRGEESHFTIQDDQISKAHCRLRVEGPVCTIVDTGSRNGTSVNGRRLAANVAQRLKSLDEIEVGSHRLLFLSGRFRPQTKRTLG